MASAVVTTTGLMTLGALVAQNTAIALTMRLAVTSHSGFKPSTAVCCDEALKLIFCVFMMLHFYVTKPDTQLSELKPLCQGDEEDDEENEMNNSSSGGFFSFLQDEVCSHGLLEYLKMSVPALLYTIQKNLLYVALSNLQPVVYQVSSQSKILTTAFFSYVMLGKYIRCNQVIALLLLVSGVIAVQLSAYRDQSHAHASAPDANPFVGIAAVQLASCTSGFSSVYFEYMLKKDAPKSEWSLWVRNIQLASFALPIALITAFAKDGSSIIHNGFMYGYQPLTWVVICLEATGGIFVALVTKYADSILKNFATALAIVLNAALCALYFGFSVTPLFTLGAVLVLLAIFQYSHTPPMIMKSSPV